MAHFHNINTDIKFYIDPITRAVKNESGKGNLIQYDHYAVRYGFELPRFVEGHDMTLCDRIEIHYINFASATEKSEDLYLVDDIQVSPSSNYMAIFSWLLSANATKYAGSLNFLIRFVCLDGENVTYSWSTDIFKDIKVGDGINNSAAAIEMSSDVLEAWRKEVLGGAEEAAKRAEAAETKATEAVEKVEEATRKAEEAAKLAKEAADRAELEGGGISTVVDNRLKTLELWVSNKDYRQITASLSVNPSVAEIGSSVKYASLTWNTSKTTKSITLKLPSEKVEDLAGKTSYTDENEYTSNKTWTLQATENDGKDTGKKDEQGNPIIEYGVATPTATLSFLRRVYVGVAEEPTEYTSAFILDLPKKNEHKPLLNGKLSSFTVNAGINQYIYYCLPTSMGTCKFSVGIWEDGFSLVDTIKFTNETKNTDADTNYYIYRSNQHSLGDTTVSVR